MEHVIDSAAADDGDDDDDDTVMAHVDELITTYELFGLPDKTVVKTHGPAQCGNHAGGEHQRCALHNPTDHHMREWPAVFRLDKLSLMERTCPHGCGHPDPDSLDYFTRHEMGFVGVHGCDGCCANTTDPTAQKAA